MNHMLSIPQLHEVYCTAVRAITDYRCYWLQTMKHYLIDTTLNACAILLSTASYSTHTHTTYHLNLMYEYTVYLRTILVQIKLYY